MDFSAQEEPTPPNDNDLQSTLNTAMSSLMQVSQEIAKRLKLVEEREKKLQQQETTMKEHAAKAKTKIQLNIGGKKFATAKSTLLTHKGTYFEAMLSSGHWKPDEEGEYFIDRDPKYFPIILNFLRSGELDTEKLDSRDERKLKADLDYYQISVEFEVSPKFEGSPKFKITVNGIYSAAQAQNTEESLCDGNIRTGVCCSSPGWIIVGFEKEIVVNNVQFTGYHGNPQSWGNSNGNGSKILNSSNNSTWTDSGKTVSNLEDTTPFVCALGFTARYVKFVSTGYLGFGILHFNAQNK